MLLFLFFVVTVDVWGHGRRSIGLIKGDRGLILLCTRVGRACTCAGKTRPPRGHAVHFHTHAYICIYIYLHTHIYNHVRLQLRRVLIQLAHQVEGALHVVGHGLQPLEEILFRFDLVGYMYIKICA